MARRPNTAVQFLKSACGPTTEGVAPRLSVEEVMPSPAAIERASRVAREPKPADIQRTAEKIVEDKALDPQEQMILEAIIIPDKRPAIDVINGAYAVQHPLWTHFSTDDAIRDRLEAVIPRVGRIEVPGNDLVPYAGTGFVVGDGLIMTNRHVAVVFAGGPGDLAFQPGAASAVDFLRERPFGGGDGGSLLLTVTEVVMIHPYWDMALLRVEGLDDERPPLPLSLSTPEAVDGHEVALLGYPAFDPRNDAEVQDRVFGGVYNVKRLMPGLLNGRGRTASFGKQVSSALHDASTLGGASGSCVVDVETGEVVALHFGGKYLQTNYGVPTADLARDGRVIDAGVNFAGTPVRSAGEWDAWWEKLGPPEPPAKPADTPAQSGKPCPSAQPCGAATVASETVAAPGGRPLSVTVRVEFGA